MNKVSRLLLVEDDAEWLDLYCEFLQGEEYEIMTARSTDQAFGLLAHNDFDVVVTDLKMIGFGNEFGGFNVLDKVKALNPSTQVIVITAYGTQEIAFRATQRGAFDIVYKPPEPDRFRVTVRGALQAKSVLLKRQTSPRKVLVSESADMTNSQSIALFGILGNSSRMLQAFKEISYAANVDEPVLIFGEKGTGKSYIANTIHSNSRQKSRPFSQRSFSDIFSHWDVVKNNLKRMSGGTFFIDDLLACGENEGKLLLELLESTRQGNLRLITALTTSISDPAYITKSFGLPRSVVDQFIGIPIFIPPLRLRKDGDDIPALAGNYVHSKYGDAAESKRIMISADAMKKLVSLEYRERNIIELYETLDKALSLIGSQNEIMDEHILSEKEHVQTHVKTHMGEQTDIDMEEHDVFISYAREDGMLVDQLQRDLEQHGIKVWRDRDRLQPGVRWKPAIRKAITKGKYFLACFSSSVQNRSKTYVYEELNVAVDELRQRPRNRAWFIPVKLNDCEIPDWEIGGGETLSDIQAVSLFENWDKGVTSLISVIRNVGQKDK